MKNRLSDQARALLASQWMMPKSSLRYEMIENGPSPEAAAALAELLAAGIIMAETDRGAVTYRLTEAGQNMDRRPPGSDGAEMFAFIEAHGRFPLAVKKGC